MTAMAAPTSSVHELVLSRCPDDTIAAVTSVLLDGRAAGNPTMLWLSPETEDAVLRTVGLSESVTLLPSDLAGRRPSTDLTSFRRMLQGAAGAARQVRVVNEMPSFRYEDWYQWRRYEAAVNLMLTDLNVLGVCIYDERRLDPAMVEDLEATHPVVGQGVRYEANARYQDPGHFCRANFDAPQDRVEQTEPAVELLDPSPAACRAAVRGFAGRHAGLVDEDLEALVFAANEAVTNATVHGRRPVRMRLWTRRTRVVVTVTDAGQGPEDCLVGLLPSPTVGGLWLSEQLVEIAHRRHQEGYTVRLTTAVGGYGAPGSQRTPKEDR